MEANSDYDNQHDIDDSQHDSEHDAEGSQHDTDDNQHEYDNSDTESLTGTGTHTRSIVWHYFTRDPDFKENKKATCDKCNKSYTCSGGSTSNLLHHLLKRHKIGTKSQSQSQELDIRDAFNNSRMKKVMYINFYFIFL